MSPVRILHLVASSRGGGAVHVRDLALGLERSRFAVQVAMPEDGGHVRREDFEAAGIAFHPVGIASGFSLRALGQIRRLVAEVDVLHVHAARAALFGRLACAARRQVRPRVVYTIHGFAAPHYPQPRRAVLLSIERVLAPLTDCFIAVSQAEREAFLAAGVTHAGHLQMIHNGIDAALYRSASGHREAQRASLGVPPEAMLVTTACRLHKPRDFETLLHAFQQASHEMAWLHLLIVGDGPLRPEVERQVERLSLAGRVTLTGWRRDLPSVYAASDVFVLTTWGWEGLPLAVLEAMAAGLPVVATDAGGTAEAVADRQTGLLVERQDIRGLAEAIIRLTRDPHLRRQMGEAGRARVAREFTLPKMVEAVERVYAGLSRGRS